MQHLDIYIYKRHMVHTMQKYSYCTLEKNYVQSSLWYIGIYTVYTDLDDYGQLNHRVTNSCEREIEQSLALPISNHSTVKESCTF